jgi:ribosomal protein L25 (general stress protein Ctc)
MADGKPNPFKAGKNRPSLKAFQEQKRSATGNKYAALAETKKKLAEKQINLVENELATKAEKHAKEMELLDLKIEAEKIDIKIKQLQYSKLTQN